jgi:AcrR family transcriptional regulator
LAGVDPALIRHFFGDKATLFATTVADRTTIPEILVASLQGDPDTVGARLTETYLGLWEEPETRRVLLALVRSATTSPRAAVMLQDVLGSRIRVTAAGNPPDNEQMRRVGLAGAHLFGVAMARHVMQLSPLNTMAYATLVSEVAPTIQRYLTDTHHESINRTRRR